MKIVIASDHAGYKLKEVIKAFLIASANDVQDLGCYNEESVNYPELSHALAKEVVQNNTRGVLICGTGIGASITANKTKGIRAALCHSVEYAKLSRQHNDANVLCLGGRFTEEELAKEIVEAWLETDFEGGRHQMRVDLIEG